MKILKEIILLAAIVGFTATCSINHRVPKSSHISSLNMISLNIGDIKKKMDSLSKDVTHSPVKVSYSDFVIEFSRPSGNNEDFSFREENLKTQITTYISGNKRDGYKKEIINKDSPIVNIINYYSDGRVRAQGQDHSEYHLKENAKRIAFPIGISYLFDKEGNITDSINYDAIFKFKFKDIVKLLHKRDDHATITELNGVEYNDNSAIWDIWYVTSSKGTCKMRIDAKTGKIILDYQNLKFIE